MTSVRAAVVQAGSVLFDTAATVAKAEHCIRAAASSGAELIVLPGVLPGSHPTGLDFGITVGSHSAAGRKLFRRCFDAAVTVPGPETQLLAALVGGGSTIVSPRGAVLAGPLRGAEGVPGAEADLDEVTRAKSDLDTVGHYTRPDVFTLTVDGTPRAAVRSGGAPPGRAGWGAPGIPGGAASAPARAQRPSHPCEHSPRGHHEQA
ncbi:nitrilase-related carbon-nitrogen hydrolase [Kocuria rosea]|uniref:nitrilase-related carbon-nitrogen hydrolase n=1 Tax=Kocuria rosea TaxID=1275 RepID=UPI002041FC7F|nr:nitrilase-related carbon-nitrogen hydrolase [Kocuria rosea]MCM3689452.1 hypothetical protein [Kocuria rosea]